MTTQTKAPSATQAAKPGWQPVKVAEFWENHARGLRIESKRARTYELRQIHLRDARECEAFAESIRAAIAAATGAQQ